MVRLFAILVEDELTLDLKALIWFWRYDMASGGTLVTIAELRIEVETSSLPRSFQAFLISETDSWNPEELECITSISARLELRSALVKSLVRFRRATVF